MGIYLVGCVIVLAILLISEYLLQRYKKDYWGNSVDVSTPWVLCLIALSWATIIYLVVDFLFSLAKFLATKHKK